jgi:hypothetical protein
MYKRVIPVVVGIICFALLASSFYTRSGASFKSRSIPRVSKSLQMSSVQTFTMRHPGGCTGMYWRSDPRQGKSTSAGPPDWPRNGAILKGIVHEFPNKPEGSLKWLEVQEYKQAGGSDFVKTDGKWMQFDQGGILLHESS